ncbi:MAG: tetratricopeptide repeat protein [Hyphomicrobiales bacterium]
MASLYGQGRYREAADAFLTHYKTYPSSRKVPDSLLKLAASLAALGETSTACATYGKLMSDYPDASAAVRQRAVADQKKYGCLIAASAGAPIDAAELFASLAPFRNLGIAVSGGADSVALMWLLARWQRERPDRLRASP